MQDIQHQISDAFIKRNASKEIRQISDTRYPIKFRYSTGRLKGSWYVVVHKQGKAIWRKVGSYPALTTDKLIKRLPDIMAEMAVNPNSNAVTAGRFETVADLMHWYIDRCQSSRHLTDRRRNAVSSIAKKHVIEKMGSTRISGIDHAAIDERLIIPMQAAGYSLSYIRQVYDIFRLSINQAHKLRLIEYNPIGGFKFTDFITASIKPKDSKLRSHNLPRLLQQLENASNHEAKMLAVMMLLHGTRIGETHRIRWDWMDWGDRAMVIPAEFTKTKQTHRIPLTDPAVAILKRYRHEQEYNQYTGVYLFPNHRGESITSKRAGELVQLVSEKEWTAHDLRKLARSCWMDLGIDYMVCELLLNHKMRKLDQTYIHTHAENQKRLALDKYHAWLRKNGFSCFLKDI